MELWELTASDLVKKIKNRTVSVREAVESVLKRSEEVNPLINAVVESMGSDAILQANALDKKTVRWRRYRFTGWSSYYGESEH